MSPIETTYPKTGIPVSQPVHDYNTIFTSTVFTTSITNQELLFFKAMSVD